MKKGGFFMSLRFKSLLCILQAFLMLLSVFSVYDPDRKLRMDRAALALTGVSDFSFAPITADALKVSESEKEQCRAWFDAHIRTAQAPAYDFSIGTRSFRRHLSDWQITIGEESPCGAVRRGGKTTIITLLHRKSNLLAQVEATIYEAYASCEWTVQIRNDGNARSPVIRRFYAADCTLETGQTTLYVSKGSQPAADDFALVKAPLSPAAWTFSADGGRSNSVLPYFNLSGTKGGALLAVGWTGQWYTSLRQTKQGVHVRAKQEFFHAWLHPGEAVRSPLVSLTFYAGDNALKGFETFRQMEVDCICPADIRPMNGYLLASEFSTETCGALIDAVHAIDPAVLNTVDYFWMDAGWYTYTDNWYDGVGNWTPDPARFPQTIKPLSDEMAKLGKRFLLWYEPERVREGTTLCQIGKQHTGWIVQDKDNLMWNLADDDACAYLTAYIAASLKENGVSIYRQDFNFSPLRYWHKADRLYYNGRRGICENHYVTNLYRYLDALTAQVDGLLIDNCASGGKRLDLEMTRRSLPLWRSDYNCRDADGTVQPAGLAATQAMTYGLSCWLPYSGTNPFSDSLYAVRSTILTHPSFAAPYPATLADYSAIRGYMTERYFPLTYGGVDSDKYLAMQFGSETAGAALIYRRENAADETYLLRLNGLSPSQRYTLTDMDDPAFCFTATGRTLMETGAELRLAQAPQAAIVLYTAQTP